MFARLLVFCVRVIRSAALIFVVFFVLESIVFVFGREFFNLVSCLVIFVFGAFSIMILNGVILVILLLSFVVVELNLVLVNVFSLIICSM